MVTQAARKCAAQIFLQERACHPATRTAVSCIPLAVSIFRDLFKFQSETCFPQSAPFFGDLVWYGYHSLAISTQSRFPLVGSICSTVSFFFFLHSFMLVWPRLSGLCPASPSSFPKYQVCIMVWMHCMPNPAPFIPSAIFSHLYHMYIAVKSMSPYLWARFLPSLPDSAVRGIFLKHCVCWLLCEVRH